MDMQQGNQSRTARILVVDDQEASRRVLVHLLEAFGMETIQIENGVDALLAVQSEHPDLVLLDLFMPGMNGETVLRELKRNPATYALPVVMISGNDDAKLVSRCIELGAEDYVVKPFNESILMARVRAGLNRKRLNEYESEYRALLENRNEELSGALNAQLIKTNQMQSATIFALSKLAESRDPETGEHLERICEYVRILATELQSDPEFMGTIDNAMIEQLCQTSPLHDIGKVGIPDRILQKPGKLSEEEFETMKLHTIIGAETLRAVAEKHPHNSFLQLGICVTESHHERWDGSGYPHRIAGENIPLAGRILALADVYDALTSARCYKKPIAHDASVQIILQGSGAHFDPRIVAAFDRRAGDFWRTSEYLQDSTKAMIC